MMYHNYKSCFSMLRLCKASDNCQNSALYSCLWRACTFETGIKALPEAERTLDRADPVPVCLPHQPLRLYVAFTAHPRRVDCLPEAVATSSAVRNLKTDDRFRFPRTLGRP